MEINRRLTENLCNMEHGDIKRLHRIKDIDPNVCRLYFPDEAEAEVDEPQPRKRTRQRRSR
jgi:hypothetical protein